MTEDSQAAFTLVTLILRSQRTEKAQEQAQNLILRVAELQKSLEVQTR